MLIFEFLQYWQEKLTAYATNLQNTLKKLNTAEKQFQDTKVTLNLEKSDLQQEIMKLYSEFHELHDKIYAPKADASCLYIASVFDAEIDARPEVAEKAVTCRVKKADKCTEIEENDLWSEDRETIKLLQAEMLTNRMQIETLKKKLFVDENNPSSEGPRTITEEQSEKIISQQARELESLKSDRMVDISERFQLQDQMKKLKTEKDALKQKQREAFEKLDSEFAIMQREFESTVQRYETDKFNLNKEFQLREEQCKIYRSVLNSLNQTVAELETAAESQKEFERVKPAIEQIREIIDSAGNQL